MKYSVILLLICLIFGCKENSVNVPIINAGSSILIPMQEGFWWLYNVTEYDTSGMITKQYFDTLRILKDTICTDSLHYFLFNKFPNIIYPVLLRQEGPVLIRNDYDGMHALLFPYDELLFKTHIIPNDLVVYQNGVKEIKYNINIMWNMKFPDSNKILDSKIGKCRCSVYDLLPAFSSGISNDYLYYLAKGKGLIKYEKFLNIAYGVDSITHRYLEHKKLILKMEIIDGHYK
jgi:hypothetical protein